jgi:hypothetical protein
MQKTKGMCYYSDNRVCEPIFSTVQNILTKIGKDKGIPITSVTLKPTDFGDRRIVLENHERGYVTYVKQINLALENAKEDYVFFTENDVLYHPSHFDFMPPKDDVFYYNNNVWRWKLWDFKLITYDNMRPLSCLCVNREFALDHYKRRLAKVYELGMDEFRSREPRMGRIFGYEPGTKKRRRGGFSDDVCELWRSELPNIDIRHRRTFSSIKCDLKDFKNKPENWQEIRYDEVPGWDLRKVFPEGMKNHCDLDFEIAPE